MKALEENSTVYPLFFGGDILEIRNIVLFHVIDNSLELFDELLQAFDVCAGDVVPVEAQIIFLEKLFELDSAEVFETFGHNDIIRFAHLDGVTPGKLSRDELGDLYLDGVCQLLGIIVCHTGKFV